MSFHLSTGWIVASAAAIVFALLYPLILGFIAWKRLHVGWRYFGFGALVFFVFQVITRVPLVSVLGQVVAPQLRASRLFLFGWIFALALTAALFEEIGRYAGYRLLMRREEKTWNKAVMYGLGHGGLESILLVGLLGLLTLVNVLILSSSGLDMIPAPQRAQVQQQLAAIAAQPAWQPLLGAWERLWTLPLHVALSVIVLQVFRRGKLAWLWLAIAAHTLVDFTSIALLQLLGPAKMSSQLIVEGVVAVFGLIAIWIIWRLRDAPTQAATLAPSPQVVPTTTADANSE